MEYGEDFLRSIDVHSLLPQQEPFVMVHHLTAYGDSTASSETIVREDNVFVKDSKFNACGMLENMAQTCALRCGFYNKYILHRPVKPGVIGAVKNYRIRRCAKIGETICTDIEILGEIFGMTLAHATVRAGEELLAEADIKLSEGQ